MARKPTPGSDDGTWGNVLNEFLDVAHEPSGEIKDSGVVAAKYTRPASGIPESDLDSSVQTKLNTVASGGASDATTSSKGILQLAGDLTGTAALPTIATGAVTASKIANVTITDAQVSTSAAIAQSKIANLATSLSAKQDSDADLTTIAGLAATNDDVLQRKSGAWTNRTPAQLKADMGLVKSDVGLSNVDNTSDANKPVSTATQTALNAKADNSALSAHISDTSAAHAASSISFSPTGTIAATDVQAALAEVASEATGGSSTLDNLTDVTVTSPASGQVLAYNGSAWVNGITTTAGEVDLSLPPYNITTSTPDIAAVIGQALSDTNGTKTLVLPQGTFQWTTTLSNFRYLRLRGASEKTTIIEPAPANVAIQIAGGETGTVKTPTANIAIGARTIDLDDVTGISIGTILNIKSSKAWEPSIVSGKGGLYGELVKVYSIAGNTVTLAGPTKWAYALADTPLVRIQSMSTGPYISDLTFRNPAPNTGGNPTIRLRQVVDARFERITFQQTDGPCIQGDRLVWGLSAANVTFVDLSEQFGSSRYGYGFDMSNGCRDWTVVDCRMRGGRHLFTTNASSSGYGIPYSARIIGCSASGCYEAPFDTHHEGSDITFEACHAEGTRAFSFQGRAPRTRFINCMSTGGSGVGAIFRDTAAGSELINFSINNIVDSAAASGARAVWLQNLDGPMIVSGVHAQDIYGALIYVEGSANGHVISEITGFNVATGEDNGAIQFTGTSANHVLKNIHLTGVGAAAAYYGPATITGVSGTGLTGTTTTGGGLVIT